MTFGDLWTAPPYPGETGDEGRAIELQVITTSLTQGRPITIPSELGMFYFHDDDLRQVFPAQIVQWLSAHSSQFNFRAVTSYEGKSLLKLPDAADIPILFAARLSLSFPILFSSIPLYAIDFTLHRNMAETKVAERCWFSDGGICSNFPLSLFDSDVKKWPRFGINFKDNSHPDHPMREDGFVWAAKRPSIGSVMVWNREPDEGSDLRRIALFLRNIMNTMQNWRDNLYLLQSGNQLGVVHVMLRPGEGGLNLGMPLSTIQLLTNRGNKAGQVLSELDVKDFAWTKIRNELRKAEDRLQQVQCVASELGIDVKDA